MSRHRLHWQQPNATCCISTGPLPFPTTGQHIRWRASPVWESATMNNSRVEVIAPTQQDRTTILAAVRKCILKRHFNVGGVDCDEWARRFDDRTASLLKGNVDEFELGVRGALAELRSSHTVFYHERTNRLLPQ